VIWDPSLDQILIQSAAGINLLFAEAASMVRRGWILGKDQNEQNLLKSLIENDVENFIALVRGCPYFSYFQFGPMYW